MTPARDDLHKWPPKTREPRRARRHHRREALAPHGTTHAKVAYPAAMEFETPLGPTLVVDASNEGQRLQGFATRAFREHLGRSDGRQHCAPSAAVAANASSRPDHSTLCTAQARPSRTPNR